MFQAITTHPVRAAAGFWGLVVFLPVGMNYLAFVVLALALLAERWRADAYPAPRPSRWQQVRRHPIWWPAIALIGWTLLVLALRPVHADTPSHLFHELRAIATLLLALALTREELAWALGGVVAALVVALSVLGLHLGLDIGTFGPLTDLIAIRGNKSVADSLILALLGVAALLSATSSRGWLRGGAILLGLGALAALAGVLPLRTALLAAAVALVAACWHGLRTRRRWLLASLAGCVLAFVALVVAVPQTRAVFSAGIADFAQARDGGAWSTSWGIRWHMAAVSAQMTAERPLLGWGIGSWREQWRARVPAESAGYNMPHNDYLWMSAQAGAPGGLLLLAMVLAPLPAAWRRRDLAGRLALIATLTLALAAATNNTIRDATIGLSLLWVAGLFLRLAAEPPGSQAPAAAAPAR